MGRQVALKVGCQRSVLTVLRVGVSVLRVGISAHQVMMPQSGTSANELDINIVAVQREVSMHHVAGPLLAAWSGRCSGPHCGESHRLRTAIMQIRYASDARHPNIAQLLDVFVEYKQIVIVVRAGRRHRCWSLVSVLKRRKQVRHMSRAVGAH